MFNERPRDYSRQMNQHAVSTDAEGYLFAFNISRASLRIAGLCAVSAGVIIAVLANTTEPFRAPLGIMMGVLTITLVIAYAFNRSSQRQKLGPGSTPSRAGGHQVTGGKARFKKSLASDLALLADLHAKGALSDAEFTAAKRRILGD
jgi:hypothetical protein